MKFHFYQNEDLLRKLAFSGSETITISIGKEGAEVAFDVDEVSRLHAQLIYDGQKVFLLDCSSTNGT